MYTPLRKPGKGTVNRFNSQTPFKGENLRQFESLLDPAFAINIINYIPDAQGRMRKRKGLKLIHATAGNIAGTFIARFNDHTLIFGYGTTIAAYNEFDDTVTIIKNDFSASTGFDGVRYGAYFFVCNGVERIWRILETGVDTFSITEVVAAPRPKHLAVFGARLIASNLTTDPTAVQYSEIDPGTGIPFTAWTTSDTSTDGGIVAYRNAGEVNVTGNLGNIIVVWGAYSKWAFTIDLTQFAASIKKVDNVVMDRQTLGGNAAIMTSKAVFYVNKAGVWQLVSIGQPNIPFSEQEFNVSYLLGAEYFDDVSFEGASIAYDENSNLLYITCKGNSSAANNFVIVYNTVTKAFSRITGWLLAKIFSDKNTKIYGISSINNKIYECFSGYDDEGIPIGTEYYQEMNVGDFNYLKTLQWFAIQAFLSPETTITITFDGFDREGVFTPNIGSYCFSPQNVNVPVNGWGVPSWGIPSWASAGDPPEGLIACYDDYKPMLRNWQRLRVRITSGDMLPHQLNLFFSDLYMVRHARVRTITKCN